MVDKIRRRDVFDEMRRIFEESMAEPFFRNSGRFLPAVRESVPAIGEPYVDMIETDKDVVFTAELPGVQKDKININVTENRIEVSVEAEEKKEKKEEGIYEYRARYEGFKSSYSTSVPVDADKAKATYKNGVLEIRVPKLEIAKKKTVKVE
jgi:HSP20 family protein